MRIDEFIDEYGEVRQADGLAEAVAAALLDHTALLFSWCDNHGSRLTLTISLPQRIGSVPGFNEGVGVLYVGVEGYGCYGFAVQDEPLHPAYIAEKLSRHGRVNPTWEALAELIGGVRQSLARSAV